MSYISGFVIAVPTGTKNACLELARTASDMFKGHGATRIVKCRAEVQS